MKQTYNGKAFEYALANAFNQITQAPIQQNSSLEIAKVCYEQLNVGVHRISFV